MEGLFFYAVVLVIMGVLGWVRRMQENKAAQRRLDEPSTSIEDMPEATRRQLYGDPARPIREARPAQRSSQSAAPPAIPTARPRQQQSSTRAATPARRESTSERAQKLGAPVSRRDAAPARRTSQAPPGRRVAAHPTMQRMRSALEQMSESIQTQMDQMEGRPPQPPAPPQRRRSAPQPPNPAAKQVAHPEAGQRRREQAEAAGERHRRDTATVMARKRPKHLLGDISELRRGIILSEVLGTPKGLER